MKSGNKIILPDVIEWALNSSAEGITKFSVEYKPGTLRIIGNSLDLSQIEAITALDSDS